MLSSLSVVIPAHNEETVVGRCLDFLPDLEPDEFHVVVVANGCTDATAQSAAAAVTGQHSVTVIDLHAAGKPGALNAGDQAAGDTFPRVYLDADVVVGADTLRRLRDRLDEADGPRVAAPRPQFQLQGRPWAVRAFYEVFERLPYASEDLVGLGVYAVNREGHARLGSFPEITADDLFVQRVFNPRERLITNDKFVVETPRSLSALVKVRTRVASGNAQLAADQQGEQFAASTRSTLKALVVIVCAHPTLLPAAACYLGIGLTARVRARRSTTWERDLTTRPARASRVRVDMLTFDAMTTEDVVDRVMADLAQGEGGVIVTPNIDIMQKCRRPDIEELFGRADVVVADGAPVVLASRVAGTPLPGRVTGSGLLPALTEAARDTGKSVFLLGGAPGVADRAADVLREKHPGLKASTYCPPFGFEDDPLELAALLAAVQDAAPDLVYIGLGAPKQERLSFDLAELLPTTWFLNCGAALTMVAGEVPRAPAWVQRLGAEWVHRLANEPRRLARRYLVDDVPYALSLLWWSLRARRLGTARAG